MTIHNSNIPASALENEHEILELAERLCWLNKRLLEGAALVLARTVLRDGTHICNDCLFDSLKDYEKSHPSYFKPKKKRLGAR